MAASHPLPPPTPPQLARPSTPERRTDWKRMAVSGARRYVFPLVLIGVAAYFDYRLNGQLPATLALAALAAAPLLFAPVVRPVARDIFSWIPSRYRGFLAASVPAAFLYVTRWRGNQGEGVALLVVGLPLVLGVLGIRSRGRLDRLVEPWARTRNRLLPRWARRALAVAVPLVLAFWLVHGSLTDIEALFGGTTENPSLVNSEGTGVRMIIATSVSTVVAYALLTEPRSTGSR